MSIKLSAEFIGTFCLVLGGCGSDVLAAAFPGVGIGLMGPGLPISGGPFQSGGIGRFVGRRPFSWC